MNGELGVGDTDATYLAKPAPVDGGRVFTDLAAGERFTCGIADSKAFCWVCHCCRLLFFCGGTA